MGVLPCSRKRCDNVMCDRYSSEHGYICGRCFEELEESGPNTNVEKFMWSIPGTYAKTPPNYDDVFPFKD